MDSKSRGRLIAFCGIDGSGKSTQQRLVGEWLTGRGVQVELTRQPTDFYRNLHVVRDYLDNGVDSVGMEGLALLAAADRAYHLKNIVGPALAAGKWVLSDRYVFSTYASFTARGVDIEFLKSINRSVPLPDLTVVLDIPAVEARARVAKRDGGVVKFEERDLQFMERFREGFRTYASGNVLVLDARLRSADLQREIQSGCMDLFGSLHQAVVERPNAS